jgi:hypothetical protein
MIPSRRRILYVVLSGFVLSAALLVIGRVPKIPESAPAPSTMTSPEPGSTLSGSSVSFSWSAESGLINFIADRSKRGVSELSHLNALSGGSAPGAGDLFHSRTRGVALCEGLDFPDDNNINLNRDTRSATVTGLPTDGRSIYVRLWTIIASSPRDKLCLNYDCWIRDYVYTAGNDAAANLAADAPPRHALSGGAANHTGSGCS